MRPRPLPEPTTALLCLICILVTLAHSTTRAGDPGLWAHIGHFTDVDSAAIWSGHYSPLFTNIFLHADITRGFGITHIIFDVYGLYLIGSMIEKTIGPVWYILFVVVSAIVGSCAELAWSGTVGIGASGVVYALFGLLWAGRYRYPEWQTIANPSNMQWMIGWGVYCIFTTYTGYMHIANGAHFGGLAFGLCVGLLCFSRTRRWLWTVPLAGILAICALSLTYMPWSAYWLWWKGERAFKAEDYVRAADYYERSVRHGGDADDGWHNVAAAWHNKAIDDQEKGNDAIVAIDNRNEAAAAAKSGGEYKMDK